VKKAKKREREVVRFQIEKKGIRVIRPGAMVVNDANQIIGEVTSSVVIEGSQFGMALVPREYAVEDSTIGVVFPPRKIEIAAKKIQKLVDEGSAKVESARILPRLLMREEGEEE